MNRYPEIVKCIYYRDNMETVYIDMRTGEVIAKSYSEWLELYPNSGPDFDAGKFEMQWESRES